MSSHLKGITENTIELECRHIQEYKYKDVESTEEYIKLQKELNEVSDKVRNLVPKDIFSLVEKIEEKRLALNCLEQSYYFKQRVISGLTELKFLEKYMNVVQGL
jgi:hypothetical protein